MTTTPVRDPLRPWAELDGTVAVVTGAAGGIGSAATDLLVRCGLTVVATDLDEEKLRQVAEAAPGPGKVVTVVADISGQSGIDAVEAAVAGTGQRTSLWLNNAGIVSRLAAVETTQAEFDRMIAVNTRSVFLGSQAAYRQMAPHGTGSVVNIASMSMTRVLPQRTLYATSKAAVSALTRNLAVEWGGSGVRVNAIAPGFVLTPMSNWHDLDEAGRARLLATIPLGRLADPSDIAAMVLTLASSLAGYVTGETIHVDGGWTL